MRESVRALIDISITEDFCTDDNCGCFGPLGGGALEQMVQASAAIMVALRVVPDIKKEVILRRGSHRQIANRFSFVGQDAVEHLDEQRVNPLDRRVVEQV